MFNDDINCASSFHDYRNINEGRIVIPKCFESNPFIADCDTFDVVLSHTQAKSKSHRKTLCPPKNKTPPFLPLLLIANLQSQIVMNPHDMS